MLFIFLNIFNPNILLLHIFLISVNCSLNGEFSLFSSFNTASSSPTLRANSSIFSSNDFCRQKKAEYPQMSKRISNFNNDSTIKCVQSLSTLLLVQSFIRAILNKE